MFDFFGGKTVDIEILPWIYEHIMMKWTHMGLHEVRSLDYHDFQVHLRIALAMEALDKGYKPEHSKKKTGADADGILQRLSQHKKGGGSRRFTRTQKFDPGSGNFVDR